MSITIHYFLSDPHLTKKSKTLKKKLAGEHNSQISIARLTHSTWSFPSSLPLFLQILLHSISPYHSPSIVVKWLLSWRFCFHEEANKSNKETEMQHHHDSSIWILSSRHTDCSLKKWYSYESRSLHRAVATQVSEGTRLMSPPRKSSPLYHERASILVSIMWPMPVSELLRFAWTSPVIPPNGRYLNTTLYMNIYNANEVALFVLLLRGIS